MPYRTSSSAGHHMACANSQSQPCQHMHNTPSRRFSAAGGVLYAVVLLTLCGFSPWPAHAKTFPRDKAALLDFYSTLSSPGDLKSSWSNTTDPCEDGWVRALYLHLCGQLPLRLLLCTTLLFCHQHGAIGAIMHDDAVDPSTT